MKKISERPLVSIIIPAYNAEKWLAECIESLVGQTYKNLEIIIVDDGSVDQTEAICKNYQQKDGRIQYLKKENAGVSAARNTGLEDASGELVCFVDADDYLDKNVIEIGIKAFLKSSPDLFIWNVCKVEGEKVFPQPEIYMDRLPVKEFQCAVISGYKSDFNLGSLVRTAWGKMFRADIIKKHQVRFQEDLYIGEDAVFLMHYSNYISKICVENYYGYFYRCVQTSLTQRYKHDLLEQSRIQMRAMKRIVPSDSMLEDALTIYAVRVVHMLVENEKKHNKSRTYNDALLWEKEYRTLLRRKVQLPIIGKMANVEYVMIRHLPLKLVCKGISLCCSLKNKRW